MAKHVPMRLCIGCRTRETIDSLVRVAFDEANDSRSLVLDQRNVLPGRGAWLHRDPKCLSTALRKRAFARAFRGRVDTAQLEQSLSAWHTTDTTTYNNDESGSEI
ncbi:hypothetical protein GCM10023190_00950 [Enteractinococcus fodinae]|uniref:RNA-binding protein YlxR (DUF448 family) n=1 Tax=Enteractinococcus fodinae TaxID=684663 RepID=A0ABU2B1X9_9MICC|nr:YlxR family protein [Enteractinococcus fodinae]MDR7347426.1 putative RNA-binding protein YlxR (DUF448 family) [Enteractinococcus fodinae]